MHASPARLASSTSRSATCTREAEEDAPCTDCVATRACCCCRHILCFGCTAVRARTCCRHAARQVPIALFGGHLPRLTRRDPMWGGINKDGTGLAQQESSGTSRAKERDMEAKASKHASKCEHACARACACVCAHVCLGGGDSLSARGRRACRKTDAERGPQRRIYGLLSHGSC